MIPPAPHYEPESERIWRCTECRKWSHAQRMPKSHERFVRDEGQGTPASVVRVVEGYMTGIADSDPGGWFVECGPFEEWIAAPVHREEGEGDG